MGGKCPRSPPQICLYIRIVSLATELKKGKKMEIFSKRIFGWCKDRQQSKTYVLRVAFQFLIYIVDDFVTPSPIVIGQVTPILAHTS